MGATLAIAVSLAMLLALLLFLLHSLLCSLLRDIRHSRNDPDIEAKPPLEQQQQQQHQPAPPLAFPFYGHGVLKAPTKYLLSLPNLEAAAAKQASPSPAQNQSHGDEFVSISNPIYDGTETDANDGGTPFATPKASPSCFEAEDMEEERSPPLKLMKKLPAVLPKSCSLFEERRSLAALTETNRPSSSPSSTSLCCSPSW